MMAKKVKNFVFSIEELVFFVSMNLACSLFLSGMIILIKGF